MDEGNFKHSSGELRRSITRYCKKITYRHFCPTSLCFIRQVAPHAMESKIRRSVFHTADAGLRPVDIPSANREVERFGVDVQLPSPRRNPFVATTCCCCCCCCCCRRRRCRRHWDQIDVSGCGQLCRRPSFANVVAPCNIIVCQLRAGLP
jgi:hypothetical protein